MERIIELEGLRGLLSLWVFMFHILAITGYFDMFFSREDLHKILDGATAVDIFIILSGFTICILAFEQREKFSVYIFRRFIRLYPIYLVCIILAFTLSQYDIVPKNYVETDIDKHILLHLTMLHGIIPHTILKNASGALLNPAWSISLEWQFYLVAPLLFYTIRKYKIIGPTITLFLSLILIRLASKFGGWDGAFLFSKLSLFWVGMISFFAFRWSIQNRAKLINQAAWLTPVLLFFYLTIFSYKSNIGTFIWLLFFTLLLTNLINPHLTLSKLVSSIFRTQPLRWLGKISYSLYLIHEIVIWVVMAILLKLAPELSVQNRLIFNCIITIPSALLFSSLSYNYIEIPTITWGKRFIESRKK